MADTDKNSLIEISDENRRDNYDETTYSWKTKFFNCVSDWSGMYGQCLTAIARLVPDAVIAEGLAINYSGGFTMPDDVAAWLEQNEISAQPQQEVIVLDES
mgnify:CR=1 FL=1